MTFSTSVTHRVNVFIASYQNMAQYGVVYHSPFVRHPNLTPKVSPNPRPQLTPWVQVVQRPTANPELDAFHSCCQKLKFIFAPSTLFFTSIVLKYFKHRKFLRSCLTKHDTRRDECQSAMVASPIPHWTYGNTSKTMRRHV